MGSWRDAGAVAHRPWREPKSTDVVARGLAAHRRISQRTAGVESGGRLSCSRSASRWVASARGRRGAASWPKPCGPKASHRRCSRSIRAGSCWWLAPCRTGGAVWVGERSEVRSAAAEGRGGRTGRVSPGEPTRSSLAIVACIKRPGDGDRRSERVPSQRRGSAVVVVLAGVVPTEPPASCRETEEVVPMRPAEAAPNAPAVACTSAVARPRLAR